MRASFLLLVPLATAMHAQTWAPIGAKWTYKQGTVGGLDTNLAVIENVGDTTINGLLYSELEATAGWFICYPLYNYIHFDGDSLWYLDDVTSDPQLLWCMNAVPGQSWQTQLRWGGIPMDTITWTVLDTTHLVEDGEWLRQLTLDYASATMVMSPYCWPACTVTERLGNWKYFFDFQYGSCDAETHQGLRCYEDSTISWLNPQFTQCELTVGIPEDMNRPLLSLWPTLTLAGSPIHINAPCGQLDVLDAAGQRVLRLNVNGEEEVTIDTPGVFTVRHVSCAGEVAARRMVIH